MSSRNIYLYVLSLVVISFLFGYASAIYFPTAKLSSAVDTKTAKTIFTVKKSAKPELSFFVMSFCPYGNEMESILKPIVELMNNKVNIHPHYIFEKIDGDLANYCKARTGDPQQCATYVENSNGQLKDVTECQKYIDNNFKTCNNETNYLKVGNSFYSSLHGRVEANQDVREICAWNLVDDKKTWWNFVANVNKNCTAQNADTCWEDQAKSANLDTNKITECFNNNAAEIINKEIELTTKFNVSGSPTVTINEVLFPSSNATTQDGQGNMLIGKKIVTQDKYRTSNTIKDALCASFTKTPKECNAILPETTTTAPSTGGCH